MRDVRVCIPYTSISDHRFHEGVRSVHVFRAHHQRSLAAGGAVVRVRVHEQGVMMDPSVRDRVRMFVVNVLPKRTQIHTHAMLEFRRTRVHTHAHTYAFVVCGKCVVRCCC